MKIINNRNPLREAIFQLPEVDSDNSQTNVNIPKINQEYQGTYFLSNLNECASPFE